jgi:hypothetical protein
MYLKKFDAKYYGMYCISNQVTYAYLVPYVRYYYMDP